MSVFQQVSDKLYHRNSPIATLWLNNKAGKLFKIDGHNAFILNSNEEFKYIDLDSVLDISPTLYTNILAIISKCTSIIKGKNGMLHTTT